jgi:biopolymer transport protein ExbD
MHFYLRRRRQPPAVIIVAMIDVLIVVLIFLMVTTTFKKSTPSIKVALPESNQARRPGASDSPSLMLVVERDGGVRLGPDATPVTMEKLKSDLLAAAGKNPGLKVVLNGDKGATWGQMFKVLDVVKESGITNLNALALPPAAK